ncbi:cobalamin-binding protein [Alginatibacterium sediminis]|uniref:Cobalamin-binding protein n=1 Tax=Alginatibacterium sediminis TaxID=2164068 RepID=A0A420E951_9ALTE|nr:cobalamin-binding protein [Alginatibacterium sediminis]
MGCGLRYFNQLIQAVGLLLVSCNTQAEPLRVITLSPSLTELVYAIGAGDTLVGVIEGSDYPDDALNLPIVGNYHSINIEVILSLKPDLVLTWASGNSKQQLNRLSALGIASFSAQEGRLDQLPQTLRSLGKRLNHEHEAEQGAQEFERELQQLRQQYSQQQPLTVFFPISVDPLMSFAPSSWMNQQLEICGLQNIVDTTPVSYPILSWEFLLLENPELIISNDPIYWQRYPQLNAVQQQQFIHVNPDYLHRLTPRTLLGVRSLCEQADIFRKKKRLQTL